MLRFFAVATTAQPTLDLSAYPATYRFSKSYSAFFYSLAGIAIGAGGLGMWYFGTGHEMTSTGQAIFMVLICSVFVLLGIFLIASIVRSSVTLLPDSIVVQGMFSTRKLLRSNIAGRRVLPTQYVKTLVLIPNSKHGKRLKIALALRTDPAFDAWFAGIPDLDAKEVAESEADLAADPDLGFHSDDRKQRVAQAKQNAKVFNIAAGVALIWGFFFPRPYALVVLTLTALPLIALLMVVQSPGIYQLEGRKKDARPSLALPFIMPGMVLLMRATLSLHLLRWTQVLAPAAVIGFILTIVAAKSDRGLQKRPWALLPILAFALVYAGAALAHLDSVLDKAAPQRFQVAVTGKHVNHGKTTTYSLMLEPWGPQTAGSSISVPSSLYYYADVGVTVCVDLYPGALGMPWYEVNLCR